MFAGQKRVSLIGNEENSAPAKKQKLESEENAVAKEVTKGTVRIGKKRQRGVQGSTDPVSTNFLNIDATSGSNNKIDGHSATSFSPMKLGPVIESEIFPDLFKEGTTLKSQSCLLFENYWQYGKIFNELGHLKNGKITAAWTAFRQKGYQKTKGDRHPVGTKTNEVKFKDNKGRNHYRYMTACSSHYLGEQMDYLTSRKKIYIPVYAYLVRQTAAFIALKQKVDAGASVQVLDFDGPHDGSQIVTLPMLLEKVNDPQHPFGHGYVLAALLSGFEPEDYCLFE